MLICCDICDQLLIKPSEDISHAVSSVLKEMSHALLMTSSGNAMYHPMEFIKDVSCIIMLNVNDISYHTTIGNVNDI